MPKKLTGKEKHAISLKQAAAMTARHRKTIKAGEVKGLYYGRAALEQLLKQKGCVGLRAYLGKKDGNKPTLVLVGVDAAGQDLVTGVILEFGHPCPPYCSSPNSLNM
jgi:hypothetical protein